MARPPLRPPQEPLTDGVIALRLRRAGDVPAIAAASTDAETRRRLEDEPLELEGVARSLARVAEQWRTGRGAPFVIADAGRDVPLGLVNVQIADDPVVAGLAVSVFPEARGRGVAARALRLAAEWALEQLRMERVFAEAATDNTASIRAIEKAGLHREGVLRGHCSTNGVRHDCVMFSLLPRDLAAGRRRRR
jgi:RimJ/RimL family protein N-acetyltransferase